MKIIHKFDNLTNITLQHECGLLRDKESALLTLGKIATCGVIDVNFIELSNSDSYHDGLPVCIQLKSIDDPRSFATQYKSQDIEDMILQGSFNGYPVVVSINAYTLRLGITYRKNEKPFDLEELPCRIDSALNHTPNVKKRKLTPVRVAIGNSYVPIACMARCKSRGKAPVAYPKSSCAKILHTKPKSVNLLQTMIPNSKVCPQNAFEALPMQRKRSVSKSKHTKVGRIELGYLPKSSNVRSNRYNKPRTKTKKF